MVSVLQERWTREDGVCVTRKMDALEWYLCYKEDGRVRMVSVLQERWTREDGVCVTRKMDA